MRIITLIALFIALLAFAAMGGFFYTYSISVMRGLDAADPQASVNAMQAINREVTNGWFAAAFFGAPIYGTLTGLACLIVGQRRSALFCILAVLIYMGGTFAVTVAYHLPLNDGLAQITTAKEWLPVWQNYTGPWTGWNHVRTIAALLSVLAMGEALRCYSPKA